MLAAILVLLLSASLQSPGKAERSSAAYAAASVDGENHLPQPLAICLGGLLFVGSIGLWWYVERRLLTPLEDMAGVVAAMSEGHLDQTLDAETGTELDCLADEINSFSVNQQEGLLMVWNQAGASLQGLQSTSEHLAQLRSLDTASQKQAHAAIEAEIGNASAQLKEIQELVRSYYLYDVCLEEQKAFAANDAE